MNRSFVYRAFVRYVFRIVRSVHFVRSFVHGVFNSCILCFSYRSCEVFVRFSFVSFPFFVRLRLVRIVNLYDAGSVNVRKIRKGNQ